MYQPHQQLDEAIVLSFLLIHQYALLCTDEDFSFLDTYRDRSDDEDESDNERSQMSSKKDDDFSFLDTYRKIGAMMRIRVTATILIRIPLLRYPR